MTSLLMVRPMPIPVINGANTDGVGRLLTPNPKEATIATSNGASVLIDFGSARPIDTIFLGYTSAGDGTSFAMSYGAGASPDTAGPALNVAPSTDPLATSRHLFTKLAAPVNARSIGLSGIPNGFVAGVLVVGLAFQPIWGREYGGGRGVTDTGSAERQFGGGFGIDEGARAANFGWTMGDLTNEERRALWSIVKDRGQTRSILMVEDPDFTTDLNERLHWGILTKLEPYERLDPLNTRWAMQIEDWA